MEFFSGDGWWEPLSPHEAAQLMASAPFPWWISGGWAVDLFVGHETRSHDDIDVGILRRDQAAFAAHCAGWDIQCAGPEGLEPFSTQPGSSAFNDLWVREDARGPWRLQVNLNSGDHTEWVFRRAPAIRLPLKDAIRHASDAIPYLAPHLQLLFKAQHRRPKDDADAALVIPRLADHERAWLADVLSSLYWDHPWATP